MVNFHSVVHIIWIEKIKKVSNEHKIGIKIDSNVTFPHHDDSSVSSLSTGCI